MSGINIHASCIVLADAGKTFGAPADAGILIVGESGSGKSDLTLRLIEKGALLVADDRTELSVKDGVLMARAPAALAGLIETRGIGIVALPFAAEARVGLVVALRGAAEIRRLPEAEFYEPPAGLTLPRAAWPPLIRLNASETSATAKISLAAAAFAMGLFRDNRNP
jgi:serine kinase of HPr protein (carbohydrate metabolism regulator)